MARRTVVKDAKGNVVGERAMTAAERAADADRLERSADVLDRNPKLQGVARLLRREAQTLRTMRAVK